MASMIARVKGSFRGRGSFQATRWPMMSLSIGRVLGRLNSRVAGSRYEQFFLVRMLRASLAEARYPPIAAGPIVVSRRRLLPSATACRYEARIAGKVAGSMLSILWTVNPAASSQPVK